MHFEAGSTFLSDTMVEANKTYTYGIKWVGIGPPVLYRAAKKLLKLPNNKKVHNITSKIFSMQIVEGGCEL